VVRAGGRHPEPGAGLLVYGLGRSGGAVVRRAVRLGANVAFYDSRREGPDVDEALALGAARVEDVSVLGPTVYPTCVAAPGVPIDHPDLAALRANGVEVIGEVEWAWRLVPGRYAGVTGTAGKGSTTLWLASVLRSAGVDAVAGGNNDPALSDVAREGATHAVELSSFQLERCPTFAPDVAVLLNLGEDHLDRHGTVAAYHAAKRNLVANLGPGNTLVYNADDPLLREWAAATQAATLAYSMEREADAWFDRAASSLYLFGEPLVQADALSVRGEHQVSNALAVALAASALGLSRDEVAAGLPTFTGLPGRYAEVLTAGGVTFIEDSIATRPLSVAAALRSSSRPLAWLAGGYSKGADVSSLTPLVAERVDLLVAFGASGPELARAFGGVTEVRECRRPDGREALGCAVREAAGYLRERHGGGTVLLAPLAASFDQFKDYSHRAEVFREVVAEVAAELEGQPVPLGTTGGGG
jgi:UDP-N-acetylmuramoylalanine--D-glutamate ligase